ncbi:hypothetical protein COB57_01580 [Candidatus Peregrinibacteria bacterium]|nr:MAG: hypothetical protein COB57_01580 [Candidatus Peregrinibacteria bacterium]
MSIELSWDLFIIVFFVVIISYSFIIGRVQTSKIILSSYLSLFAADAIGNYFEIFLAQASPVINIFDVTNPEYSTMIVKMTVFIAGMVLFAVKGAFEVYLPEEKPVIEFSLTLYFGFLSAAIIISGILVYISGGSFLHAGKDMTLFFQENIYSQSYLVQFMILNKNLWFLVPVLSFLGLSFIRPVDAD